MTNYKAMIEEHSCKPNQGCGVMTICMCGVAEDMANEIERLREALRYYANKTQEEWMNVTGADDGVVARAALGEKE